MVICDPFSVLLPRDETLISDAVGCILEGTSKGFVVLLKYNKMNMEPDVLAQLILASTSFSGSIKSQTSYRGEFQDQEQRDRDNCEKITKNIVYIILFHLVFL